MFRAAAAPRRAEASTRWKRGSRSGPALPRKTRVPSSDPLSATRTSHSTGTSWVDRARSWCSIHGMPLRTGTTTLISGRSLVRCSSDTRCPSTTVVSLSKWRRCEGAIRAGRTRLSAGDVRRSSSVSAVVLTHRRPRLASMVVRSLIEREGLLSRPSRGRGQRVRGSRRPNIGVQHPSRSDCRATSGRPVDSVPGWRLLSPTPPCTGPISARTTSGSSPCPARGWPTSWVGREWRSQSPGRPVGAVVAYGRRFVGRGAHTVNLVPAAGIPEYELVPVDVASWGATLLARRGLRCRHRPRPGLVLRTRGLRLLLPGPAGGIRRVGRRRVGSGRGRSTDVGWASRGHRTATTDRRHARRGGRTITLGTPSCWRGDTDAPRGTCGTWPTRPGICRRPRGRSERKAILHGLWDGVQGSLRGEPRLWPDRRRAHRGERATGVISLYRICVARRFVEAVLDGFTATADDRGCR